MAENIEGTATDGGSVQPPVQQPTPIDGLLATGTDRDARGRYVAGHSGSDRRTTGERSPRILAGALPEQAEARAVIREMRIGIERDLGGAVNLSSVRLNTIDSFCALSFLEEYLLADVLARGVMTTKGRQRAVVSTLMSVIDRKARLAQLIGLERVSKRGTLADIIANHQAHAQQPAGATNETAADGQGHDDTERASEGQERDRCENG